MIQHFKKARDRSEILLYPHVNQWVSENNSVRILDKVVEAFVKENIGTIEYSGKSEKGCSSYGPDTMLKLLLYGYFNWITGSRRIEKETYRNMEVIWLIGDLKPDHWTICKFRRENKDLIRSVAIELRRFLLANGYIEGKQIAIDGSKMKANASRDMFSEKTIIDRINNIEQQIDKYLDNSEETDEFEARLENESKENNLLKKKIKELEDEREKLKVLKDQLHDKGKNYISPTDPDANLMQSRDGKMACYNVQTGVDAKNHMIVLGEVTSDVTDMILLKTDFDNIKRQLDLNPEEIEADKGYANIGLIKEIEESNQTKCIIPLLESDKKNSDFANGIQFIYDQENNQYTCPNNKKLKLISANNKQRSQFYNTYKCKDCTGCPLRSKCTTSKSGRIIKININNSWISLYKQRLSEPENIKKIAQRKTIVEHPFGTIKLMMGKLGLLLRNQHKVQIEVDLYTTAYNLKRLISIESIQTLIQKIENYKWKVV
jgi:transposase